jgi:hypothetical protein
MQRSSLWLGALLTVLAGTQSLHAQVITSGEIERGLRYPATPSYGGEPYTQRYNYGRMDFLYLNGDSRNLYYMDYLDRADRAAKFGYRMPIDPFFEAPHAEIIEQPATVVAPPVRVYSGFGFGHWRRR